jgi:hypothetical protein
MAHLEQGRAVDIEGHDEWILLNGLSVLARNWRIGIEIPLD